MDIINTLLAKDDFTQGKYWTIKKYAVNDEIVTRGDTNKTVYFLKHGKARVLGTIEVAGNKRVHPGVYDLTAGEVFGELVLFDDEPRSANVVALEDCEVVLIDGEKLNEYLDSHSDLGYALMREFMSIMVGRLRKSNQKVFSLLAWGLKAHHIDEHLN